MLKTQTQNDYGDYSFHALSRDETGLLTYTKVNWFENSNIDMDNDKVLLTVQLQTFK